MIKIVEEYGSGTKMLFLSNGKEQNTFFLSHILEKTKSSPIDFILIMYNGDPILNVSRYLRSLKLTSDSLREKEAHRIGYLYEFLYAFNIDENTLVNNEDYIRLFWHFIKKENYESETVVMKFSHSLNPKSALAYISSIKEYLKFINISGEFLDMNNNTMCKITDSSIVKSTIGNTDKSLSIEEILKLYNYAKLVDLRFKLGVEIMFITGMRIGTLLGITEEDIQLINDENGKTIRYIIKARNRFSDSRDQLVKNLAKVKVKGRKIDLRRESENRDYFIYDIPRDTYYSLIKLIKDNRKRAKTSKTKTDNYDCDAVADRYYEIQIPLQDNINHYIFLNDQCTRFSQDNWNKRFMRKAFSAIGIPVDINYKLDGLNHRIRHCALSMIVKKGMAPTIVDMANFLKNKSLETVPIYLAIDNEDKKKTMETSFKLLTEVSTTLNVTNSNSSPIEMANNIIEEDVY